MFIEALEDCMEMVNSTSSVMFESQQSPITDATLPPSPLKIPSKKVKWTPAHFKIDFVHVAELFNRKIKLYSVTVSVVCVRVSQNQLITNKYMFLM